MELTIKEKKILEHLKTNPHANLDELREVIGYKNVTQVNAVVRPLLMAKMVIHSYDKSARQHEWEVVRNTI